MSTGKGLLYVDMHYLPIFEFLSVLLQLSANLILNFDINL